MDSRPYSTPFALPGLGTSVAEGQMPAHMQQIAGASQSLLQLPVSLGMPREQMQGNGGYGGRTAPAVSLLNDTTTTGNRMSPRDAAQASPANSSGPASVPRIAEGSMASNGSNQTPLRGSSPPIRPIEIHRFPFLSPAMGGEGALVGGARSGLTPASLPNILNTTTTAAPSAGNDKSASDSSGRSGGGAGSQSTSSKQPAKFSSLHHMVADVHDDSEYDERDDASSADGGTSARKGKGDSQRQERKRKRRKVDEGRRGSEEVDQTTPLGRDPVSSGYVTEHQARELFGM